MVCGLLDAYDALVGLVPADGRLLLTGGGARSAVYRQLLADLSGRAVTIPEVEEAVATGACVQAASVLLQREPVDIAEAWSLGGGDVVEPARLRRPRTTSAPPTTPVATGRPDTAMAGAPSPDPFALLGVPARPTPTTSAPPAVVSPWTSTRIAVARPPGCRPSTSPSSRPWPSSPSPCGGRGHQDDLDRGPVGTVGAVAIGAPVGRA